MVLISLCLVLWVQIYHSNRLQSPSGQTMCLLCCLFFFSSSTTALYMKSEFKKWVFNKLVLMHF